MAERASLDFGPIQKFMEDPLISEIMVNGPGNIFIDKYGKKTKTDACFESEEQLFALIKQIFAGHSKRIAPDVPFADVCLDDGTRINVILHPLARFGTALTIRKFLEDIRLLDDLQKLGTISPKVTELLVAAIKGKVNIMFSGGTATGKTTLLQMLSAFFNAHERVITIEDATELHFTHLSNYISLETRSADESGRGGVTLRHLVHNALRMAPDRIILGEVRGEEAVDLLQAMSVGHTGTLSVIHGSSPRDVIARLETMVMLSGIKLPVEEVRKLICSTVHMVVHLERMQDGSRKVTYITELRGLEGSEIVFNDLFMFNFEGIEPNTGKVLGSIRSTLKYYPSFFRKLQKLGLISDTVFVNA